MDLLENVLKLRDTKDTPHFAVFDFDNTMIVNDCAEAVLAFMARHPRDYSNAEHDFKEYYSKLKSGDTRTAYRFGASTLKGLSIKKLCVTVWNAMAEEERHEITNEEFLDHEIHRGIALRSHVVRLANKLEVSGVKVWVVSASPESIVRATMRFFGLNCELIGVRNVLQGDADGDSESDHVITGAVRHPLPIFEGKVECIQHYIHPTVRPLLGVGDNMNDHPMLRYAQLQAVVDRGNELTKIARNEGWFILDGQPSFRS